MPCRPSTSTAGTTERSCSTPSPPAAGAPRPSGLLTDLGVAFDYLYIDKVGPDDQKAAIEEVEKSDPALSFPTVVIGEKTIVGFKENEIREALA